MGAWQATALPMCEGPACRFCSTRSPPQANGGREKLMAFDGFHGFRSMPGPL